MNINEFIEKIKALDAEPGHVPCGDNWDRVFIHYKGISIGRASFKNGELFSVKNYKRSSFTGVCETDEFFIRFNRFQKDGYVMPKIIFWHLAKVAEAIVEEDYHAKKEWRQQNPHPKGKCRSKLVKRNDRNILYNLVWTFDPKTETAEYYIGTNEYFRADMIAEQFNAEKGGYDVKMYNH